MNKISFELLSNKNGHILLHYQDDISTDILYFHLTPATVPSNDALAIACYTLSGSAYKTIELSFPISESTKKDIEKLSHAHVLAPVDDNAAGKNYEGRKGHVLSFSGGLDSLAAKCLMPEDTSLVSMDFGGRFSREREFFGAFNPYTVSTNLADTHLRKNSYLFMRIAAVLFDETIKPKYHTYGTILEASNVNLYTINKQSFPFDTSLGTENAYYVYGMTEIGTALVCLHYLPDIYSASLKSVASAGENKKYRKQLISKIVADKLGKPIEINNFNDPNITLKYGEAFADDLLTFYFIKHAGIELTGKMIEDIPEEVIDMSHTLELTFMERLNTDLYKDFPSELKEDLYNKALAAQVFPYDDNDFKELEMCRTIIKKYAK